MPYKDTYDLPDSVKKNLPPKAKEIYMKAYNSAWEQYKDPDNRQGDASREEVSHKVAWSAVKKEYEKDKDTGKWKKKD
jgi:cation transport regulator